MVWLIMTWWLIVAAGVGAAAWTWRGSPWAPAWPWWAFVAVAAGWPVALLAAAVYADCCALIGLARLAVGLLWAKR